MLRSLPGVVGCSIRRFSSSAAATTTQPSLSHYLQLDHDHVMHPYTSMTDPLPTHLVREAEGVHLTLEDGSASGVKVVDGMSSWWAAVHGYRNKVLDQALKAQIDTMSHVMFGGLSHKPAIDLCKLLVDITPEGLNKVFLCDSGSVSVEVALKMAIQYWFKLDQPRRSKFLTIRNSYHGDTFGAMSVCDPVNSMHTMFNTVLPHHMFVASPSGNEKASLAELASTLESKHREIAGVILEPIVQGAGGMCFYSPGYLKQVRKLCDEYGVLLILDEIATGFGRTGELFACNHGDGVIPDILCLGKALTGGYMTMGATLANDKVCKGVSKNGGVFMHGPTFMGNPLAAATALASVNLLLDSPWKQRVQSVESRLQTGLAALNKYDTVRETRVLGAIGVCELKTPVKDMAKVQDMLISKGVWLRPFGKLLYTMPPFNAPITNEQVDQITDAMEYAVARL